MAEIKGKEGRRGEKKWDSVESWLAGHGCLTQHGYAYLTRRKDKPSAPAPRYGDCWCLGRRKRKRKKKLAHLYGKIRFLQGFPFSPQIRT